MVQYQAYKYKSFVGSHLARVIGVEVDDNQFYRPDEENSTKEVLHIEFELEDGEVFKQKFVSPLTGGKGVFASLVRIAGLEVSEDGGNLDEQNLVGVQCVVLIEKNKKDYDTVTAILPIGELEEPEVPSKPSKGKKSEDAVGEDGGDLPF